MDLAATRGLVSPIVGREHELGRLADLLADPAIRLVTIPGPAGMQPGSTQGAVMSVIRAAGAPPIITFGWPLMIASGSAGWGTGVGTGAAG